MLSCLIVFVICGVWNVKCIILWMPYKIIYCINIYNMVHIYLFLLFTVSFCVLFKNYIYLSFYLIGFLFCFVSNVFLKIMLKQPNLIENKTLFNIKKTNKKNIDISSYGMPCDYSQFLFFTVSYLYFSHKNTLFFIFFYFFIFYCFNDKSSLFDIIVGIIVGIFTGYLFYLFARNYVQENYNNTEKKYNNVYTYSNPL